MKVAFKLINKRELEGENIWIYSTFRIDKLV